MANLEKMQTPKDLTDFKNLQGQTSLTRQISTNLQIERTKLSMEQMKRVLMRRTEDSGQRHLDDTIMTLRAASYVKHMEASGVSPEDYNAVYEAAVVIYNSREVKGPFSVDYMVQAAQQMSEVQIGIKTYERPKNAGLVSCTTCQGSKISYKMDGTKIIGINKSEDGKVLPCEDCK